jgi:hypothetical protein
MTTYVHIYRKCNRNRVDGTKIRENLDSGTLTTLVEAAEIKSYLSDLNLVASQL